MFWFIGVNILGRTRLIYCYGYFELEIKEEGVFYY
jgi:hypothetical protein